VRVAADHRGAFYADVPERWTGEGVELAFFDPDGHRFFRHFVRPQLRVWPQLNRVELRATAGLTAVLAITSPLKVVVARTMLTVPPAGIARWQVPTDIARPPALEPGADVGYRTREGADVVRIEPLSFDFSPHGGIIGWTVADRQVLIRLDLAPGAVAAFSRLADRSGQFELAPDDIPPGEQWQFEDVDRITVILPTLHGHEIVVEADLSGTGRQLRPLFLPWLGTRTSAAPTGTASGVSFAPQPVLSRPSAPRHGPRSPGLARG